MRCFVATLLLMLALPVFPLGNEEPSAAEKYNSGDYLGAAQDYLVQAQAYPGNPYILYNLGNSYFKAGDTDKALVYYLRAFKILPRDADIRHNLAFTLQATGQKLVPDGIPDMVFNLYYYFSVPEMKGLCAAFAWLTAILLIVYFFLGRSERVKTAGFISLALFVFLGFWLLARYPSSAERIAVVTVPRAELRSGPGDNFPVGVTVPRARVLSIEDNKGEWSKVVVKGGDSSGWVLDNSIEEI